MKRSFLFLLVVAVPLLAETTHSATLLWADSLNPPSTLYNVYRAPGLCSGTPVFAKIATALSDKEFKDTTVTPGNYCYAVTATASGVESAQSNASGAAVPAFPPTALSVTVQ